jgi:hypothetical protein
MTFFLLYLFICPTKYQINSLEERERDCRLSTGLPPAADYVGCEARRRTSSERETRTEELCEIKWDYHIVGTMA